MKALENNRNIAKPAREFGMHIKQVGGCSGSWWWVAYKSTMKISYNSRNRAEHSDISVGDTVIVQRDSTTKMKSVFNETPMTVVDTKGSQVTVEPPEGKTVTRNKSRVKRYRTDSETMFCRQ